MITLFFYKKLDYPHGVENFLDFGHFLDQKVSDKFLISSKDKKFWGKMGQSFLKKVKIAWKFPKMVLKKYK